jgi:hypothetical protein
MMERDPKQGGLYFLLKIGGLEKTVAAFSLAAWCVYSANLPILNTLKSCKTKTNPKFGDTLFSRTSEFSTHQI